MKKICRQLGTSSRSLPVNLINTELFSEIFLESLIKVGTVSIRIWIQNSELRIRIQKANELRIQRIRIYNAGYYNTVFDILLL